MADEKVVVEATTEDDASGPLKKLANTVEDLSERMQASLKEAEGASRAFAAGIAAAGAIVVGVAAVSINAARDQIAVDKQLEAVLKSTGGAVGMTADEIRDMASALSQVTNFGDDAIQQGQNMLLTFTKIGKDVFPLATEAMLNMSAAMGTDLKSTAIQLGKALNDPIAGVTALRKVGVSLTEEQEKMIAQFVEVGDMASAQKVVLNELAVEFGGVATAVADPLTMIQNRLGDVAEAIGFVLMPYVLQLTDAFFRWFNAMGGAEAIAGKVVGALQAIAPYFPIITGAIIGGLVPALYASAAAFTANVIALGPFIIAGAAIAGIAYMIYQAYQTNFLGLKDFVDGTIVPMFQFLAETIGAFFSLVMQGVEALRLAWETNMYGIRDVATAIWTALTATFTLAWNVIKNLWSLGIAVLKGDWEGAWQAIRNIAQAGIDYLLPAWTTFLQAVGSLAQNIWEGIKATFKDGINAIIRYINSWIGAYNKVVAKVPGGRSLSLPDIPALGDGGVVMPSAGGTIVRVAEAGRPEAIIPLDRARGMGGGVTVIIEGNSFYGDDESFTEKIADKIIRYVEPHLSFNAY